MARWTYLLALPLALVPLVPPPVHAQQAPPAQVQSAAPVYTQAVLEQILAPIALYPDDLLTQVLIAATYPLEVVMASRWLDQPGNKALKGDPLLKALAAQDWDASVKSLVPLPSVLRTMSDRLDWTQQLGDAFLAQQADVLAAVQVLRGRAQKAGTLKSTPQQTVTQDAAAIVIQPAQANTMYVPGYNPSVAYGEWPYPSNPPVYYPPPAGYYLGSALATGLAFGAGIAVTSALWGWGSPGWSNGSVNVNVNRFNTINASRVNNRAITSNTWQHNAAHRRGVGYSNANVRQQYRPNAAGNAGARDAFRGRGTSGTPGLRQGAQGPAGTQGRLGDGRAPGNLRGNRPDAGAGSLQGRIGGAQRPDVARGGAAQGRLQAAQRPVASGGAPAFRGLGNGGATRQQAAQGRASRNTMGQAQAGGRARAGGGGHRGGR
ncbi:MAG: DUF3300 domain-containing protein [Acetobacteraceae bacterium]